MGIFHNRSPGLCGCEISLVIIIFFELDRRQFYLVQDVLEHVKLVSLDVSVDEKRVDLGVDVLDRDLEAVEAAGLRDLHLRAEEGVKNRRWRGALGRSLPRCRSSCRGSR